MRNAHASQSMQPAAVTVFGIPPPMCTKEQARQTTNSYTNDRAEGAVQLPPKKGLLLYTHTDQQNKKNN